AARLDLGPSRAAAACCVEWWFGDRFRSNRSRNRGRRSGEVEAIEVHDLVPRSYEVADELLLRIVTCVDLGNGSELRVRTEDKVNGGGGPLDVACCMIQTIVHVLSP